MMLLLLLLRSSSSILIHVGEIVKNAITVRSIVNGRGMIEDRFLFRHTCKNVIHIDISITVRINVAAIDTSMALKIGIVGWHLLHWSVEILPG